LCANRKARKMERPKEEVFIARKYVSYEVGGICYYEEGVFDSYDAAYDFIKTISVEDSEHFLSEIVRYNVNDKSPWEGQYVWVFDREGNLRHSSRYGGPASSGSVAESYTEKFMTGDIVLVRPFPHNEVSPTSENVIGVVIEMPIPLEEWLSQGNEKDDWDNTYVIYHIRCGYLDHIHVEEKGIGLYMDPLPANLAFLKDLSDHVKGKRLLKSEIVRKAFDGEIFVEQVRHLRPEDYVGHDG